MYRERKRRFFRVAQYLTSATCVEITLTNSGGLQWIDTPHRPYTDHVWKFLFFGIKFAGLQQFSPDLVSDQDSLVWSHIQDILEDTILFIFTCCVELNLGKKVFSVILVSKNSIFRGIFWDPNLGFFSFDIEAWGFSYEQWTCVVKSGTLVILYCFIHMKWAGPAVGWIHKIFGFLKLWLWIFIER